MPAAIEKILSQVKELPNDTKVLLAEKIIEIIDRDKNFDIEKAQLVEVKKRRDDILSGVVIPINGEIALQKARSIINEI